MLEAIIGMVKGNPMSELASDQAVLLATLVKEVRVLNGAVQALVDQQSNQPPVNPHPVEQWAIGVLQLAKIYKGNLNISADKIRGLCRAGYFTQDEAVKVGTMNQGRWKFHVENCRLAIKRFEQLPIHEQQRMLGKVLLLD